jgi:hypothetical protein
MKCSELVLDFNLYPRQRVDDAHVSHLGEAVRAGAPLPPVIVDRKSKRVTDGFHRVKLAQRDGEDAEIDVILRDYADDREMLLDAMRLNASHGRALTACDRARCIQLGLSMKLDEESIAGALSVTLPKCQRLKSDKLGVDGTTVKLSPAFGPYKPAIRHKRGQPLTKPQQALNAQLGGFTQTRLIDELIKLIQTNLIDTHNRHVMDRLQKLHGLLDKLPLPEHCDA